MPLRRHSRDLNPFRRNPQPPEEEITVPLTQSRFLLALDEALSAHSAHITLRGDLYRALESNVPDGRKLDLIADLLDRTPAAILLPLSSRKPN
jgi:hypothetical protein